MKTIVRLFVFLICLSALYAEQVPISITYFYSTIVYFDSNFRYIMKEVPSDLYVFHEESTSNSSSIEEEHVRARYLKEGDSVFTHFIVAPQIYPGEEYVPPVYYDTTKLRLKWYKKYDEMNAYDYPVDFYVLNKNKVVIDSIRLTILRISVPHEKHNISRLEEIKKYIDPRLKTLIKYEINDIDRWSGIGKEFEGDPVTSAQSISHRCIRDSLGDNFYDPFGTNWDNFNREFTHLYDNCIVSHTYPGCDHACGSHNGVGWKMMTRRHIAVHNAAAAANFRKLTVIGNNGDKRRYGRGLWVVDDSIPTTDEEIKFYRALMCVCPTLPIKQDLVFNDLTTVEENTSLIESKVFPNPSSRHFTVQGQAFTEIYVYDVLGTLIEKSIIDGTGQWKNNSALYLNGHYTIQLRHSDGTTENLSVTIFQ